MCKLIIAGSRSLLNYLVSAVWSCHNMNISNKHCWKTVVICSAIVKEGFVRDN
jgi:hypothetical protein